MEKLTGIAEFILREAKTQGADAAQCSVTEEETREFNVDGGEFSLMRTLFDRSVSVTVIKAHRLGRVQINRFDDASLRAAVASCVAASESAEPDEARQFADGPIDRTFTHGAPEADAEALFARTREFMADIAARHPKLLMEQLIADHVRTKTVYMNSNGVTYRDTSGCYHIMTMYSAKDGERSSASYGGTATLDALDTPIIDLPLVDREMSDVERQADAQPTQGKFVGTALFAPACLVETVFGEILDNFASDGALLDGTSLWKDKLGTQVADPRVSLSLAPLDGRIVCGERYTDEGYPTENCDVIRGGVLESFCLSQYAANKLGLTRSGNTSPSMIVAAGDTPLSEIIAGIDRGVLLMRFSGGSPAPSGEFSGVAKNGFLIENGRITGAVTETMISGNLADMLQNVQAVSRETLTDGAVCAPYMAFRGVTVSGK